MDLFLRRFVPYCVRWDLDKNYYVLNRDYEYLYLGTKRSPDGFSYVEQRFTFNDESKPWRSKVNYKRMCDVYKDITKTLNTCLNHSDILSIVTSGPLDDQQLRDIFMLYLRDNGITVTCVDDDVIWDNNNNGTWETMGTFNLSLPRSVKSNLIYTVAQDPGWYTRSRYPKVESELYPFDIGILGLKNFCGNKRLRDYVTHHNLKPILADMFEMFYRRYNINEGVWFYKDTRNNFYMFGDMHEVPYLCQSLINFLHDVKLYDYTRFYDWTQGDKSYWVTIKNETINFHRSYVWVTRIPRVFTYNAI
jgi:hypothetical protein